MEIVNNITSHSIRQRDGARGTVKCNIANAPRNLFMNYTIGDLHLTKDAQGAIDKGVILIDSPVTEDIDGDKRDKLPDIGADELEAR